MIDFASILFRVTFRKIFSMSNSADYLVELVVSSNWLYSWGAIADGDPFLRDESCKFYDCSDVRLVEDWEGFVCVESFELSVEIFLFILAIFKMMNSRPILLVLSLVQNFNIILSLH